ncbi:hypothetical protein E3N88_05797 [Mikania micrantha]|uniref:Uncharacterized protein n=1 Tax=Mikania micrantha TaxID=192012 RepID=A0A5N6PMR3_9ASTR|nr:hypothetical protein E3N88_05797 [Mikania micrantha]
MPVQLIQSAMVGRFGKPRFDYSIAKKDDVAHDDVVFHQHISHLHQLTATYIDVIGVTYVNLHHLTAAYIDLQ